MEKSYNPQEIEKRILQFWEENKIEEKALIFRKGKKKFFFLDGPPYATGHIHIGTAWNKILKDFYIRSFRMLCFDVWSQPGYDTHGLPIENKVEKKLGFKKKDDIEKFGVESFNNECKKFATEFIDVMNSQFDDLGVWMDWKNPYLTLGNQYIEGAWYTFKVAFEKGFLYKGLYPVHVCSHCATAVAYNEIEYFKATDPSIAVKFRVKGKEEYLVIWTTTPWTLLANTGIMVNPNYDYVKVKVNGEVLVIAEGLLETVMKNAEIDNYEILEKFKGRELEGLEYENPLKDVVPLQQNIKPRVILSELYVTLEDGTGLVHTAPGHGSEDYKAGKENNLAVVCPVKLDGTYDESAGRFKGMHVKEADILIIKELEERNALLFSEKVVHDYPKCWRCSTPLLQITVPQWFFRVSAIRDDLIKENSDVYWVPEWGKKRFENWLESLSDWPISRQRYWGIPLPIWVCEKCEKIKVIGSGNELPHHLKDFHRPYIDEIVFKCDCGGNMKRVQDVLDVWFDSGVASWASLGYPKNKKLFEELWPAELNLEGSDQIRGWWNSEMITSVMTFGKKPFKSIVMHGLVLGSKGVKMSKSLGNIVTPEDFISKYGRDILRFYLLNADPSNDFWFEWEDAEAILRFFTVLYNSFIFFNTYCKISKDFKNLRAEDKYLLSKINSLVKNCEEFNKKYEGYKTVKMLEEFVLNDLSRWYIKLIKDRTWPTYDGKDKEAAFTTLYHVLERVIKILAPACPFVTEYIYQELFKSAEESIHLCSWPAADEKLIDEKLERQMDLAKKIVEASNALRQESGIKLKYALPLLTVSGSDETLTAAKELKEIIAKMANVMEVKASKKKVEYTAKLNYSVVGKRFGKEVKELERLLKKADATKLKNDIEKKGKTKLDKFVLEKIDLHFVEKTEEGKSFDGGKVFLDTKVSAKLREQWLVRELIRTVQDKRKKMGLQVADRIKLYLPKELEKFKNAIEEATGSKIAFGKPPATAAEFAEKEKFVFNGKKYEFRISI